VSWEQEVVSKVLSYLGVDMPDGDQGGLHDLEGRLRTVAADLDQVGTEANYDVWFNTADDKGAAIDAFRGKWQHVPDTFNQLQQSLLGMADVCENHASWIDQTHSRLESIIEDAAGQIIGGGLLIVLTAGVLTDEVIAQIADSVTADVMAVITEYSAAVATAVTSLVRLSCVGVMSALGSDLLTSTLNQEFSGGGPTSLDVQAQDALKGAATDDLAGALYLSGLAGASTASATIASILSGAGETPLEMLPTIAAVPPLMESTVVKTMTGVVADSIATDIVNKNLDVSTMVENTLDDELLGAASGQRSDGHQDDQKKK
jgi:hypothetical protein